jgi:hypothetical protein
MTISAGIFRREAFVGKWKSRIQGIRVCRMNDFSAELRYREDGKLRICLIRDSEFDDQAWRRLHAELKKLPLP